MKIFTLTKKQELQQHRPAIETLFYNSFGHRELGDVWDWAYLDNPNGEPIVSLCYQGDELVGHYAIVPMPLSSDTQRMNSYISMTTMVAESHRKFGLFTQLALATYEVATAGNIDFVFGFPNSQSTPGFRRRLNWVLPESDYVATIDKATLMTSARAGTFNKAGLFGLDLSDPIIGRWRLSRPSADYRFEHGVAYKRHQNAIDLLWWDSPESLDNLPENVSINVLVLASSGLTPNRQFDYQFGGIGLKSTFDAAKINREMAISDLF